eukprot:5268535-Pyramimonas_sp.AAC.1
MEVPGSRLADHQGMGKDTNSRIGHRGAPQREAQHTYIPCALPPFVPPPSPPPNFSSNATVANSTN